MGPRGPVGGDSFTRGDENEKKFLRKLNGSEDGDRDHTPRLAGSLSPLGILIILQKLLKYS